MDKKQLKEIRNTVFGTEDEPKATTTKEAFRDALRCLRKLKDGIDSSAGWTAIIKDTYDEVAKVCTRYAMAHSTAFDEPMSELRAGVKNGTVTVDGWDFRLTITDPGKPVRELDANFDKDFVESLPDRWCTMKRVKVDSKIKAASQEELAEFGITCPTEYKWSINESKTT